MSLLVEIATRADVPLESVVRVLTREPVGDGVKARVLEVLDDLDPDETRVLQRFALAAVHDALPRLGDHEAAVDDSLELPEKVVLELEAGEPRALATAPETLPAAVDAAPLVQLGSVLTELTEAVRELRHETDAERRERVDDLAVLIDLITKGWEGVDRRLGRVERQLGRLHGGPQAATTRPAAIAARVEPPPVPAPDPPPPPPESHAVGEEDELEPERSTLRRRAPLIAALAFGIAIGALLAIDLPSRFDASAVIGNRSLTAEAAQRAKLPQTVVDQPQGGQAIPVAPPEPGTGAATTTSRPKPPAPPTPAKTPTQPPARPAPPAAPRTTAEATTAPPRTTTAPPRTTTAPPRTTTTRAATTAAPPPQSDFTPSRNWAWPPVEGADYYFVEFFRAGQHLYLARPTVPRLRLPDSIEFVPGVYRWRVRAGRGVPSANRLDPPIVDSQFVISR